MPALLALDELPQQRHLETVAAVAIAMDESGIRQLCEHLGQLAAWCPPVSAVWRNYHCEANLVGRLNLVDGLNETKFR